MALSHGAKPSPIALVVCDNVYREPGGKTALVGLFNSVRAKNFPASHSRLCVYVSVTECRKDTRLKLDLVHSETDEVVFAAEGSPPPKANPTTICDLTFLIENAMFKEPGRYYIRFWGNDHLLLQRPFEVERIQGERK